MAGRARGSIRIWGLAEAQGEQIRVLHDEAQAHRLARQAAQVGALFPGDGLFDGVADDFLAVWRIGSEGVESGSRGTVGKSAGLQHLPNHSGKKTKEAKCA